ncbi:MAG: YraN family protein [Candidatus Competibacteraceae bacterium]
MESKPQSPAKLQAGEAAETLACRYLERQGLVLIERNYRCRTGEVDLIMRDGDCLVFVEVRSRRHSRYGTPAETVTRTKQQRICRAAAHYLLTHHCNVPCRFDVIAILQQKQQLDWIKGAFQAD